MAHERYRRRYWLLGVGIPGFVGPAHHRAWCHVDHLQQTRRGWPWVLHEPTRCPSGAPATANRRVRPHVPIEDDAGCCTVCNVPTGVKNALHLDRPPAAVEAARAVEHRKRID
jgi:hypothetical protein